MRIILDLGASAGGALPAATLQVGPDEIDRGINPSGSTGSIVAMDAGAARFDDGASPTAPVPVSEQASAASALNAGQAPAPAVIGSTDRTALTSQIAPALWSEESAGSAPSVIDEFEVPPAIARRIR